MIVSEKGFLLIYKGYFPRFNSLRNEESFFEHYEVIKYGWGDQIQ